MHLLQYSLIVMLVNH